MATLAETQQAAIDALVDAQGLPAVWKSRLFALWHSVLYPNDKRFDFNHFKRHLAERVLALPDGPLKDRLLALRDEFQTLEDVDPATLVDKAIDGS